MKKTVLLVVLVAFASGLVTGCSKTPTTPSVNLQVAPKPGGNSRSTNTATGQK